ncbi:MAG: hypothetical protein PVF49_10525 [Anaerolineales bacterium]
MTPIQAYIWLFLSLVLLIPLQRWIHRHLQGLLLLLTRNPVLSQGMYALLFFPGVLVHEGSHWLVARLLGVEVVEVSLLPQREDDGRLRFGFVEIADAGRIRSALIGIAPLVFGTVILLLLSNFLVDLDDLLSALFQGNWRTLWAHLWGVARAPDALLWLYLSFAISNAMLPSGSDRSSFLPGLIGLAGGLLAAALIWDLRIVFEWLNSWGMQAARFLALAFSFTLMIDVTLVIPIWLAERAVTRLTGLTVQY